MLIYQSETFNSKLYIYWTYGILGLFGIFYLVYNRRAIFGSNDDNQNALPIELVNSEDLRDAWTEEFIIKTKIPHRIYLDDEKVEHVIPINPKAVRIRNCEPEASMSTVDVYYKFDAYIQEGDYEGSVISVAVPMTKGIEGVRKNIRFGIREKSPLTQSNFSVKNWNTPVSHNARMEAMKIMAEREGYSKEDASDFERLKVKEVPVQNNNANTRSDKTENIQMNVEENTSLIDENDTNSFNKKRYDEGGTK